MNNCEEKKEKFDGKSVDLVVCQRIYQNAKCVGITHHLSFVEKGDIVTDGEGDYCIAVADAIKVSQYDTATRELLKVIEKQKMVEFFEVDEVFRRDKEEEKCES